MAPSPRARRREASQDGARSERAPGRGRRRPRGARASSGSGSSRRAGASGGAPRRAGTRRASGPDQHETRRQNHRRRGAGDLRRRRVPGPRARRARARRGRVRRTWPARASAPGPGENRRTSLICRPMSAIEPATNAVRSMKTQPTPAATSRPNAASGPQADLDGATEPHPGRDMGDGEPDGEVRVLRLQHRERQEGQPAAHASPTRRRVSATSRPQTTAGTRASAKPAGWPPNRGSSRAGSSAKPTPATSAATGSPVSWRASP